MFTKRVLYTRHSERYWEKMGQKTVQTKSGLYPQLGLRSEYAGESINTEK